MAQRKIPLSNNEFYHIYNRGVDKRVVFKDKQDFFQFIQMLDYFNQEASLGSMTNYKYPKYEKQRGEASLLVEIVAYCLNKNHYHLILKQVADDSISKFMQKVGTGYAMYFNKKYKRTGALFGGPFKSKHIGTDAYLNRVGVYVNLNNQVHGKCDEQHGGLASLLRYVSSWGEYMGTSKLKLCKKEYLMGDCKTPKAYKKYAEEALRDVVRNKIKSEEMKKDLEE